VVCSRVTFTFTFIFTFSFSRYSNGRQWLRWSEIVLTWTGEQYQYRPFIAHKSLQLRDSSSLGGGVTNRRNLITEKRRQRPWCLSIQIWDFYITEIKPLDQTLRHSKALHSCYINGRDLCVWRLIFLYCLNQVRWSSIKFYVQPYSTERDRPRHQRSWYTRGTINLYFDRHINFSSFIFMLPYYLLFLTGQGGIMKNTFKIFVQIRFKDWGAGKEMTLKIVLQMSDVIQWTGFILLRIRFSVRLLKNGFPEIVGAIVQLLFSHEERQSMVQ